MPVGKLTPPEHWPDKIQDLWKQTHDNLQRKNLDASLTMARTALQLLLRTFDAQGNSLKKEIDDLFGKNLLPQIMKDWSDELRLLANSCIHPEIDSDSPDEQDVQDLVNFLDYLLVYLLNLPKKIEEFRSRK